MNSGLFFNILQLISIYLHFLSIKKNNNNYSACIGFIYLFSVLLKIVRYDIVTFVLFVIQIFVFIAYPLKNTNQE